MSLGLPVRLVAMVVVLPFIGAPSSVQAAAPAAIHYAFLDLGDDDGDGIPNYLDPDDNDDGVTDEDTPTEPEAEPGDPAVEAPPTTPEPAPQAPATSEPPAAAASPAKPVAQVVSLPDTGTGGIPSTISAPLAASALLCLLALACFAPFVRSREL